MNPSGHLLGDRYQLESVLASGGMGQVWRARDTRLHRPVAVKVLRPELTGDPTFLGRFRAEARHAAQLSHPGIAAVDDYGETVDPAGGRPIAYLVMELVDGEPLSDLLAREGRLDLPFVLRILRRSADALAAAHEAGVVHRDVKPGNVLITPTGDVKITDFGISRSAASARLTRTGTVVGTPHYLSPEQAQGLPATAASDVYALGVLAYECLAGRRPFEAPEPVQVVAMQIRDLPPALPAGLPLAVRRLVGRALVKNPAERLRDGAALRDAVDDVLAGTASATGPATRLLPTATGPATVALTLRSGAAARGAEPADTDGPASAEEHGSRRTWLAVGGAAAAAALVLLLLTAVLGGGDVTTASATGPTSSPRAAATSAPTTPAPVSTPPPAPPAPVTPVPVTEAPTPVASATVPPSSAEASTAVAAPSLSPDVVAAAMVGRPLPEVRAELAAGGLRVRPRAVSTDDVPEGQVTEVDFGRRISPGETVTVRYAVATTRSEDGDGGGDRGRGGHRDD